MNLLLVLLFGFLAFSFLNDDWRKCLFATVVIGFVQDPIRKITEGQPSLYVGLVLIAFLLSAIALVQSRRGQLDLRLMFCSSPTLNSLLPVFLFFIAFQSLNSLIRWGFPALTFVGVCFYLAPLVGIWVGFQAGRRPEFLLNFLRLYLVISSIFAFTTLLNYWGLNDVIFKAIGKGQFMNFRYGFSSYGSVGFWRSTDIAAIHLTFSACFAVIFGFLNRDAVKKFLWFGLAFALSLISLLTGRRKSIVQIFVFLGLFLFLLYTFGGRPNRQQIYGALVSAFSIVGLALILDPSELIGGDFAEYSGRATTAPGDLFERFNQFGLNAFWRGLEISDYLGIGVGILAQTGVSSLKFTQGRSFAFVAESGLGKVTAELGLLGVVLLLLIAFNFFKAIRSILLILPKLPYQMIVLEVGLLAFALSNLPFFSSAAGVYGDPFVLIICGISLGSFLAVPALIMQQQPGQHPPVGLQSASSNYISL